jgi:hypothetical protein
LVHGIILKIKMTRYPNERDTYECKRCNEKFRLKSNLLKHLREVHYIKENTNKEEAIEINF